MFSELNPVLSYGYSIWKSCDLYLSPWTRVSLHLGQGSLFLKWRAVTIETHKG